MTQEIFCRNMYVTITEDDVIHFFMFHRKKKYYIQYTHNVIVTIYVSFVTEIDRQTTFILYR